MLLPDTTCGKSLLTVSVLPSNHRPDHFKVLSVLPLAVGIKSVPFERYHKPHFSGARPLVLVLSNLGRTPQLRTTRLIHFVHTFESWLTSDTHYAQRSHITEV